MWFRILLALFFPLSFFSQQQLEGSVRDATSNSPIPFCAVGVKHSPGGTLANEDGKFIISAGISDTIVFQHPGYQKIFIPFSSLAKNATVLLKQTSISLSEVPVYAKDDWLYELVSNCRNSLLNPKQIKSKAYFTLQSNIGSQPVELLECYYNASFTSAKVSELKFKNGRAGAARYGDRYFMNLNSSKVFTSIDLLNGFKDMPHGPLEFNLKKLRKNYVVTFVDISNDDLPVYHLAFVPKIKSGNYFGGEIWIQKETNCIRKIKLNVPPTQKHPFLPMFPNGKVVSVAMQINKVFTENNLPEHLDFNYSIKYAHSKNNNLASTNIDTVFDVDCKGLLYFYDHDKGFILPFFEYNDALDDYKKITLLSYNDQFWQINKGTAYSNSMIEAVKYFRKNGELINYQNKGRTTTVSHHPLSENNFIIWSPRARLSLKGSGIINDTSRQVGFTKDLHNVEKYNIKVQLFMDLNQLNDSLQHHTVTVLDTYNTFYNFPEKSATNCFLNIYFDIFEIYRRQLEKELSIKKYNAQEASKLYNQILTKAKNKSEDYLSQVARGKNFLSLEKWNQYVIDEIGIDNMMIFGIRSEQTSKSPGH